MKMVMMMTMTMMMMMMMMMIRGGTLSGDKRTAYMHFVVRLR